MRKTGVLIGVFAALILIYILTKSGTDKVVSTNRKLIEADSAKIDNIKIESSEGNVDLIKQGESWQIAQPKPYPANMKFVGDALSKLAGMKQLTLISNKTDRQGEFEVDDNSATKVTFTQNGKSSTILLGKAGSSMQTSFVRLKGSNDIWEVGGNNLPSFKKKPIDWRDKTITDINMAAIKSVRLEYPKEVITVTLVDSVWRIDAGKENFSGEKSNVERLTRMLSKMNAVEFADTLSPDAFDHPDLHLTADLANGDMIEIKAIPKDPEGTQYFVRKTGAKSDFVLYKATVNALMKKADDFKNKPMDAAAKPNVKTTDLKKTKA